MKRWGCLAWPSWCPAKSPQITTKSNGHFLTFPIKNGHITGIEAIFRHPAGSHQASWWWSSPHRWGPGSRNIRLPGCRSTCPRKSHLAVFEVVIIYDIQIISSQKKMEKVNSYLWSVCTCFFLKKYDFTHWQKNIIQKKKKHVWRYEGQSCHVTNLLRSESQVWPKALLRTCNHNLDLPCFYALRMTTIACSKYYISKYLQKLIVPICCTITITSIIH